MSNFDKATARPWHWDSINRIRVNDGRVMARCQPAANEWMDSETEAANARLIVAAVNSYDALRGIAEGLLQHAYCPLCGCDLWNTAGCPLCPIMRQAKDTLEGPQTYPAYSEPDERNLANMAHPKDARRELVDAARSATAALEIAKAEASDPRPLRPIVDRLRAALATVEAREGANNGA